MGWLTRALKAGLPLLMLTTARAALAVALAPADQIQVTPSTPDIPKLTPPADATIRLEAPAPSPLSIPQQAPETLRVTPVADPWVAAEVERLKSVAAKAGNATRGSRLSTTQRRAAAEAAWHLGLIYFHGAGVPQNAMQAHRWFERAQEGGHPLAAAGMAMCAIDGCSGPADPHAAAPWIDQLARSNAPRALFLRWLMTYRLSPITWAADAAPGETATVALPVRDLLVRAAAGGDPHARMELGLAMAAERHWADALHQFERAATQSSTAATNAAIVRDILSRQNAPSDASARSRQLLQEAQRWHRGEGVPANYGEALRLYRDAERAGSEEAGRMLALIASRPTPGGGINTEWMRQLSYIDLSQAIPTPGSPALGQRLQREPSPLYDWLPQAWKDQLTGRRSR